MKKEGPVLRWEGRQPPSLAPRLRSSGTALSSPGLCELGLPPADSTAVGSPREMETWALPSGSLGPRKAVRQGVHHVWVSGARALGGAPSEEGQGMRTASVGEGQAGAHEAGDCTA